MILGLLMVLSSLCQAAVPVLHAGEDPRVLLAKSAAATKHDVANIRVMTIAELVRGKPAVMLGGGRVESCYGPPTTDHNLREAVDRIERAMAYLEYEKALAHVQVAEDSIRCLSTPADAQRISRLFYLKGLIAFEFGEKERTNQAFDIAFSIDPELVWDEYFPPDARPVFDAVALQLNERPVIKIDISPIPEDGFVWVDGRRLDVAHGLISLRPGAHLIQVVGQAMTSHWLTVKSPKTSSKNPSGHPRLIVPSALTQAAIIWSTQEEKRPIFDVVLSVLYDPDVVVYFSINGVLVSHRVGTDSWEELKIPSGFSTGGNTRLVAGRTLMWAGLSVSAGGMLLTSSSWLQASAAARKAEGAEAWADFSRNKIEYDAAIDRMSIGRWVTVGGLVALAGGVGLQYDDLPFFGERVAATWIPFGGAKHLGGMLVVTGW